MTTCNSQLTGTSKIFILTADINMQKHLVILVVIILVLAMTKRNTFIVWVPVNTKTIQTRSVKTLPYHSFIAFRLKTRNVYLNITFKWSVFYTEPFWEKKSLNPIYFSFDFESNLTSG